MTAVYADRTAHEEADDTASSLLELIAASRPTWHAGAACRGYPQEWWFPERGGNTNEARAVCAKCPVRAPCLAAAMAYPSLQGIWGNTSHRQRLRMRQRARGQQSKQRGAVW